MAVFSFPAAFQSCFLAGFFSMIQGQSGTGFLPQAGFSSGCPVRLGPYQAELYPAPAGRGWLLSPVCQSSLSRAENGCQPARHHTSLYRLAAPDHQRRTVAGHKLQRFGNSVLNRRSFQLRWRGFRLIRHGPGFGFSVEWAACCFFPALGAGNKGGRLRDC